MLKTKKSSKIRYVVSIGISCIIIIAMVWKIGIGSLYATLQNVSIYRRRMEEADLVHFALMNIGIVLTTWLMMYVGYNAEAMLLTGKTFPETHIFLNQFVLPIDIS